MKNEYAYDRSGFVDYGYDSRDENDIDTSFSLEKFINSLSVPKAMSEHILLNSTTRIPDRTLTIFDTKEVR